MGKVCYAAILLLGLIPLICGCGSPKLVTNTQQTPTPAQTKSPPLAVVQAVAEENLADVLPPPELPVSTKRLEVKPKKPPRPTRTGPLFRGTKPKPADKPRSIKKPKTPSRTAKTSQKNSYPKADPFRIQIEKAEAASRTLDSLVQTGQLAVDFHGTGSNREMVHVSIANMSRHPVLVRLTPGMILKPPNYQAVQPLLTAEKEQFLLQPGQVSVGTLQSYCMDSRVPAPARGESVNYRFSTRTKDGGPRAVKAYLVAQKIAKNSPYRHAITQFAIWKALGQPTEEKHFQSVLGPLAKDQAVRREVLRQVDKVLKSL